MYLFIPGELIISGATYVTRRIYGIATAMRRRGHDTRYEEETTEQCILDLPGLDDSDADSFDGPLMSGALPYDDIDSVITRLSAQRRRTRPRTISSRRSDPDLQQHCQVKRSRAFSEGSIDLGQHPASRHIHSTSESASIDTNVKV